MKRLDPFITLLAVVLKELLVANGTFSLQRILHSNPLHTGQFTCTLWFTFVFILYQLNKMSSIFLFFFSP